MKNNTFICIIILIFSSFFLIFPMVHHAFNKEKVNIERESLYLRCIFSEEVKKEKEGTKINKIMKIEFPRKTIGIPSIIIIEKKNPYMKAGYQLIGVVYNKGEEICLESPQP